MPLEGGAAAYLQRSPISDNHCCVTIMNRLVLYQYQNNGLHGVNKSFPNNQLVAVMQLSDSFVVEKDPHD